MCSSHVEVESLEGFLVVVGGGLDPNAGVVVVVVVVVGGLVVVVVVGFVKWGEIGGERGC